MNQTYLAFPGYSICANGRALFLLILQSVCALCAHAQLGPRSAQYDVLQKRLRTGWNTWDVHSVTAHVLLPAGLSIRVGVQRKTTLNGEAFLADPLIGRQGEGVEQVFPGPHAWNGSYTDLRLSWPRLESLMGSKRAAPLERLTSIAWEPRLPSAVFPWPLRICPPN